MPTRWVNDQNRERRDDDERGFADAKRHMAETRVENQAEAEAFGERELEERGKDLNEAGTRTDRGGDIGSAGGPEI